MQYIKYVYTSRVSTYMHAYTLYSSIRPFGATIMLGSWDKQVVFIFIDQNFWFDGLLYTLFKFR